MTVIINCIFQTSIFYFDILKVTVVTFMLNTATVNCIFQTGNILAISQLDILEIPVVANIFW